jgi:hypothetical protein
MRSRTGKWRAIYAAAALACIAVTVTAGPSDKSYAWHAGALILILEGVAMWRVSKS